MILVDTSVWIDHFRKSGSLLAELLEQQEVLLHPFVLGELACGNLKDRKEIVSLLHALPTVVRAEDDEVLFFIERHKLMGKGIGLIDAHLMASCSLTGCALWTRDKRLLAVAREMNVSFQ